ncbi:unnamed protein product [Toxocara canis]|uniref:MFS domain-containing protein n=1 Tax=Toxocara canis TaxID=6265 RepID=A0A183TVF6_TOXCA|nr:unnamed protein product [Toxocara canis]
MFQTSKEEWRNCFTRTRFVVMPLLLLCLSSLWANILCFNIAQICMNPDDENDNITTWLTGSVALSAIVAHFPLIIIINRLRVRIVFTILGFLSGIATLLMPLAFHLGFACIVFLRAIQGIAFASNFIVIGVFAAKWTYYKQSGLFVSILVSYMQLAPTLSNPISGAICSTSLGWTSIFYGHGIFTVLLFLLFLLFYRNTPSKHPLVGHVEANKISINKIDIRCAVDQRNVPYVAILKTAAVWAVWIAAIGNFYCVNTIYLFADSVLFKVSATGVSAALPPVVQFVLKVLAGFVSDKIRFIGETAKLRIFNSVAFWGASAFAVALAFLTIGADNEANVCIVILSATTGMLGICTGGFYKAGPMISGPYSAFVTGNVSLALNITMFIVPFIMSAIAPDNTAEQWRTIFLIVGGVMVSTNLPCHRICLSFQLWNSFCKIFQYKLRMNNVAVNVN